MASRPRVGGGGSGGFVKAFLEGGQCLHWQFDEVVQFLVSLGGHGIDKFHCGFKNKIGCVISEWIGSFNVVGHAKTSGLCSEFACGGFAKLFDNEGTEVCKGLVTLGICIPIHRWMG